MAILQLHTFVLVFYSLSVQCVSAFRLVHLLESEVRSQGYLGKKLEIHAGFFPPL